MKVALLVAVPAGVVTVMWPVVAAAGTVVTILVAVSDAMVAAVPLNATLVAPDRFWPVMVTVVPGAPEVGLKLLIFGATVKVALLVAVPAGVVTVMWPVVAAAGTVVTILVAVSDAMVAAVPLNATLVAPDRFWPVMVTVVPGAPEVGVKLLIFGVTVVVIRPIEVPLVSPKLVNHSAPSGRP